MTPITIKHLGAETCVTGSCHLVQFQPDHGDGVNILVDCGIAYGHDPQVPFDRFPVPPGTTPSGSTTCMPWKSSRTTSACCNELETSTIQLTTIDLNVNLN